MSIKHLLASRKRIGKNKQQRSLRMRLLAYKKNIMMSVEERSKHGKLMAKKRWNG